MIQIVIDTNVYGWYVSYSIEGDRKVQASNSFILITKLLEEENRKKIEVLATETIEREVKEAENAVLSSLFYSLAKGIIKKTKRIEILATEYFTACRHEGLRFVTIDDCEIVAATAIAGIKLLVTENRKTLNNPKVKEILNKMNASKKLKEVRMADSKEAMGEIFV